MPCMSPLVMSICHVDRQFSLKSILGVGSHGAFSVACLAQNIISNEEVAIKLESFTEHLSESPLDFRIPQLIWFGRESSYQALVLDSIAMPLCDIMASQGGLLSLNSVLLISCQLLQLNHATCIMTPPLRSTSNTKRDVPLSVPPHFLLSAITYICYEGPFPGSAMQTLPSPSNATYNLKHDTMVKTLCDRLPIKFVTFIKYSHSLAYGARPDYDYLKKLLEDCIAQPLPPPEGMHKSIMATATMPMTTCMKHLNADSPTKACGQRLAVCGLQKFLSPHYFLGSEASQSNYQS
ncbi:hypothetical protein EDC04DRAFT_2598792 [Pisolithus marmoratus]|nr:hypothetical protein EDC04DRAFT_2598792 [Pisolithus marmoratus]